MPQGRTIPFYVMLGIEFPISNDRKALWSSVPEVRWPGIAHLSEEIDSTLAKLLLTSDFLYSTSFATDHS